MLTRGNLLQQTEKLLKSQGFKTSDFYEQGSFDLVARKKLLILLLKTFVNIDSINEQNAHEMKQLANIFLASPIIIGSKSRNGLLEEGVIYERYDIPTIGFDTFKNMILYNEYPEILADRGGYFVKIDGNVIKQYRDEYSMSLKELASLAHVSRATMYKYENGIVPIDSLIFSLFIIKTGSEVVIIDKSFRGIAILFKVFSVLFFSTFAINGECLSEVFIFATASNGPLLVDKTP